MAWQEVTVDELLDGIANNEDFCIYVEDYVPMVGRGKLIRERTGKFTDIEISYTRKFIKFEFDEFLHGTIKFDGPGTVVKKLVVEGWDFLNDATYDNRHVPRHRYETDIQALITIKRMV